MVEPTGSIAYIINGITFVYVADQTQIGPTFHSYEEAHAYAHGRVCVSSYLGYNGTANIEEEDPLPKKNKEMRRVGSREKCPCGSMKKYKICCGK